MSVACSLPYLVAACARFVDVRSVGQYGGIVQQLQVKAMTVAAPYGMLLWHFTLHVFTRMSVCMSVLCLVTADGIVMGSQGLFYWLKPSPFQKQVPPTHKHTYIIQTYKRGCCFATFITVLCMCVSVVLDRGVSWHVRISRSVVVAVTDVRH